MTPIDATPNKSEILLKLSIAAHALDTPGAEAQMRLRKGFDALMAAVRKVDGIPAADIDQFIRDAQSGAGVEALLVPAVLFATSLPDEDYFAAMVDSGMFDGMTNPEPSRPPSHPKFIKAMERIGELHEEHGPEAAEELPECKALWEQALEFSPPEFMQVAGAVASEMGLLPEAKFVNEAGEPVYSAEQIAEKLGMPVAEVENEMRERFADKLEIGNVYPVQ